MFSLYINRYMKIMVLILSVYYICKYVDKYIAYMNNLIDIVDNFKYNVDNY